MFARSQTTVCLHANKCLPTGKHAKKASKVPENMPYCSLKHIASSHNSALFIDRGDYLSENFAGSQIIRIFAK